MPRPQHCRRVGGGPKCNCFKPAGTPARFLDELIVTVDEYEAIRLADMEGLYQEKVAEMMGVSRQTVGRILQSAHKKIAEALVHGKAIRIEGGAYVENEMREFICTACKHGWSLPYGGGRPASCPECGGEDLRRIDSGREFGRGFGKGRCGKKS